MGMKVLKAALCLLVTYAIIVCAATPVAHAEGGKRYAMAVADDVYVYDEMERNTELFALPYTYCVEIAREYDDWYRVVYAQNDGFYEEVIGYCKKDNLLILNEPPENLYLNYPVEITLTSGDDKKYDLPALQLTVTCAFYGNFYRANTPYIYLKYDGGFGYVEGKIDDYVKNEIPSAPTVADGSSVQEAPLSAAIPLLVIGALAVAAVIALVVSGKKSHKRQ